MKRHENIFNDNHLKLMRVHIGLIVFYFVLFAVVSYGLSLLTVNEPEQRSVMQIFLKMVYGFSPLFILHLALAIGAKKKLEVSRRLSEIVFVIMFLAFPIGTILSALYFLPKTVWVKKES